MTVRLILGLGRTFVISVTLVKGPAVRVLPDYIRLVPRGPSYSRAERLNMVSDRSCRTIASSRSPYR